MKDADQQTALAAVRDKAEECRALLEAIGQANRRIEERARSGDPVAQQVVASTYNRMCRLRAEKPIGFGPDPAWQALSDDPDLKAVCDDRYILGERVDVLRERLSRLDSIAPQHDELERCIRTAITGVDRNPDQLAAAVARALDFARAAAAWQPRERRTLLQRLRHQAEEHPVIAPLILLVSALAAVAALWGALPEGLTDFAAEKPPASEAPAGQP